MMRSRSSVILAVVLVSACTFQDGNPWGHANFDVSTSFDEAGRAQDGGLKTSKDYLVKVDSLQMALISVSLNTTTANVSTAFDPADPPQGYGLCHNGHCHSEDGRLVDYADIAAELAGATATGGSVVQEIDANVDVFNAASAPLGGCFNACDVERGFLQTVSLSTSALTVTGKVFDTRTPSRLPDTGLTVTGSIPLDAVFSAVVTGEVGTEDPAGIDITVTLTLSAAMFDALDFATLQADGAVDLGGLPSDQQAALIEKVKEQISYQAAVSRYDL